MSMSSRGAVVRCAFDAPVPVADVTSRLAAKNVVGITPTTGTTFYRIAYRTYREDGVEGISSARVYLPMIPRSLPLPVVAIGHPTEGIASSCAPTMTPTALDDLALPWAARGFAVVASDYAGLGNGGIQGYGANHDTAHSLLDSARALRAMLDPRALDDRVLLAGYSQGGGAVLAAQGLAGSYGAGGDVVAAIVMSAEYFSRMNSFGYVDMLRSPTELTIATGISMPVVAAMRDYAYGANVLGLGSSTALFPAGEQSGMQGAITTLCQTPFGGYLQGAAVHVGDLFDPAFAASFLACVDGTGACAGVGGGYYHYLQNDLVAPDPAGPPVLYVQGLADIIMPPQSEAACNLQLLQAAGVRTEVCVDGPAMHTDITARDVGLAEAWSEAKLDGTTPPSCTSSGMPTCQP
jgi:predicted esterase